MIDDFPLRTLIATKPDPKDWEEHDYATDGAIDYLEELARKQPPRMTVEEFRAKWKNVIESIDTSDVVARSTMREALEVIDSLEGERAWARTRIQSLEDELAKHGVPLPFPTL
jgi:hypothetical protein